MSHPREVKQAVFGLLTSMLVIDGKTDDAELSRLIGHAKKHPAFAGMTGDELAALSQAVVAELKTEGVFKTLARWAVAVPADQAEPTFELIVRAMLADGVYHEKEGALGDALREALKVSKERALQIADRVTEEIKAAGRG